VCNIQYYLNDDISLFTGCCVNLIVRSNTFLYVILSVTDKNKHTDGELWELLYWNVHQLTEYEQCITNDLLIGQMFTKSNPNISKHLFIQNKHSLQRTSTDLIVLCNSYNELHKMNPLQDRLLHYKKNNNDSLGTIHAKMHLQRYSLF
jgi:hypothetical protein